jgi:hypothetical protein
MASVPPEDVVLQGTPTVLALKPVLARSVEKN